MYPFPISLLRQAPLFAALDDALLQELASHTRQIERPEGASLFFEGDSGDKLFIIISGQVNIQRTLENGQTVHIARRGPGEIIGEMALIDGKPRMADAVVETACKLLLLMREDFLCLIEKSPRIALGIMACLADRLREAADHLIERDILDTLGRVSKKLLELMENFGVDDPDGGTRIETPITHQQIGKEIGYGRESVCRTLSSLKAVGAIRKAGRRLVVMNPNKLRQYCDLGDSRF